MAVVFIIALAVLQKTVGAESTAATHALGNTGHSAQSSLPALANL